MSDAADPLPAARYTDLAWRGTPDPMRAGFTVLVGFLGYVLVILLVNQSLLALFFALNHRGLAFADYFRQASEFRFPEGFLAANITLALLAVVAAVVARHVLGLPWRFLISVEGRARWGYFAAVLAVAAVVINACVWLFQRPALHAFHPQADAAAFLVIMVLTSPLQAAAEEFFFRGLLLGAFGALTRRPWIGIIGSALVFALFHGTQSLPLFLDRFGFGVLAGLLALATGGLEAGIAAHIVNNLCAFTYAALFSTIAQARTQTTLGWPAAAADLGTFAAVALAAWLVARWRRPRTQTPDAVVAPGLAKRTRVR